MKKNEQRLFVAGAVALAVSLVLGLAAEDGLRHFLFSYLVSYAFFLSIALGALFFVALQHVTGSHWSVVIRRLAEILAATMPVLAILFIPILVSALAGTRGLYPWAGGKTAASIGEKAAWLNGPFFAVRFAVYFAVWIVLARGFHRRSVEQDRTGDRALSLRSERLAGPALVLFAFTITFAAFDLLMSLEPAWYSTIFGVYYFSGAVVGFFAAISLGSIILERAGRLPLVTSEHYHDLGKLLFAFVFFWGYIAFSQYLLIWYANLPEETVWFAHRQVWPWAAVGLVLISGNFAIPFLGLLSRHAKRQRAVLGAFGAWLLVMHWVDLYWIVMPGFDRAHLRFWLGDLTIFLGIGALVAAAAVRIARRCALVPLRDPRLQESVAFQNV